MARKPGEWWDKSWSVVTGCTPAGAGCEHCWAASMVKRFPKAHEVNEHGVAVPFSHVLLDYEKLPDPLRRKVPTIYAVSLLGDLFHEKVDGDFISKTIAFMVDSEVQRRGHVFVMLTKRVARAVNLVRHCLPRNAMLMASVWDQQSADAALEEFARLPEGVLRGLHVEPMLGPITLKKTGGLRWVVCGGENGPGARWMDPAWARRLYEQCNQLFIPYWFKGWGTAKPQRHLGMDESMACDGRREYPTPWRDCVCAVNREER